MRFKYVREKVIVNDLICGQVEFDMTEAETNPDMTIRRADGSWIFHFVNVVDDAEMRISHVIRGEDHLSNTPKHIQLYNALGLKAPAFAHIPLILNKDGSKMSKRDQGASMLTYMQGGYAPEAVRNYLCLLGWSPKDNREKIAIDEVVQLFDLNNISRRNAAFDLDKLLWLNSEYLRDMSDDRFCDLAAEALTRSGFDLSHFAPEYVHDALRTCKGKVRLLSELASYAGFYFKEMPAYNAEGASKHFTPENKPRLLAVAEAFANLESFSAADLEATLKETAARLGVKVGALVHPTRLAVSGSNIGPSLYHLLEILGKEAVCMRIGKALAQPAFNR